VQLSTCKNKSPGVGGAFFRRGKSFNLLWIGEVIPDTTLTKDFRVLFQKSSRKQKTLPLAGFLNFSQFFKLFTDCLVLEAVEFPVCRANVDHVFIYGRGGENPVAGFKMPQLFACDRVNQVNVLVCRTNKHFCACDRWR